MREGSHAQPGVSRQCMGCKTRHRRSRQATAVPVPPAAPRGCSTFMREGPAGSSMPPAVVCVQARRGVARSAQSVLSIKSHVRPRSGGGVGFRHRNFNRPWRRVRLIFVLCRPAPPTSLGERKPAVRGDNAVSTAGNSYHVLPRCPCVATPGGFSTNSCSEAAWGEGRRGFAARERKACSSWGMLYQEGSDRKRSYVCRWNGGWDARPLSANEGVHSQRSVLVLPGRQHGQTE